MTGYFARKSFPTSLAGLAFALFLFAACASRLAAEDVRRIIFEQTGYEFSTKMLKYNLQMREGDEFVKKTLDDDVKRLYGTGYFQQVKADVERAPDGRVDIVYKTRSKPRIRDILFEGNKKFKDPKLRERVTLEPGMPLNDKKLKDSLSILREFYFDEGYYETTITPITKDVGGGQVDLVFKINEHLRLKVNSVDFVGNTVFFNMTLQNAIQTKHSYLSWILNLGLYDKAALDDDKIRLRNLYWTKGYLDFRVTKVDLKPLAGDPEYVDVTFHLEEGKPYIVENVTITGNERFPSEELLPLLKMRKGKFFDYSLQQRDVRAIGAKYYRLGYADFDCVSERSPNFANHTVDVNYAITEGRQYKIRDINISGNHVTKDKVIRRELPMQPGQPVDNDLLTAARARLVGMGYFKKVTIVTTSTSNPGEKDVEIKVEEKKTASFTIGAGYSSEDSFGGSLELKLDNFDLFAPKNYFMGGGQRFVLRFNGGFEINSFLISFTEPWLFDMPLSLKVDGYYRSRFYENWDESHAGGSVSLSKRFFDDFTSFTVGHRLEAVRVRRMEDDHNTKYFTGEEGTDFLSTTSLLLARDTRDNLLDPKSGYRLALLGEMNAADKVYYRIEASASGYYPFLEDLFVLHGGVKYGVVDRLAGQSDSDMAPIYERYFLGGGDTIRGFPYRRVGPYDRDEHVYGGQSMMLATVELTHPIWKFIRGAAFVDAGGAWKDAWDMDFNKFNVGAGYGLRLKLPQFPAPIKLDLGFPVLNNQDNVKSKLRFSFSMGVAW
ncbi:MAG: outer membrane protein assembly factor BamA [Kiritimatiellaeota bacterium]|nr:outer membrane protein assembly factor BamA [Kiritimatiellota bacterium]